MTVHVPKSYGTPKRVYLNGKEIQACFYADDVRGIVKCYRIPIRLDKYRKRALSVTRRGTVRVELIV